MTAHALITGILVRPPERRQAKSGKSFVAATVATEDRGERQHWSVMAFAEDVCGELLRLKEGDALGMQGPLLTLSVYAPDNGGAPRVNARLQGRGVRGGRLAVPSMTGFRQCLGDEFWG